MNETIELTIGDLVLLKSGQKTNFFEIIEIENDTIWITDGWVQLKKSPDEIQLICKAESRQDQKIPFNKYVKRS